jgi:N-acyl-phosphatidylethanolamine-hydrolysing phospholipase D
MKILALLLALISASLIQVTQASEDTMANFTKAPLDEKGLFTNVKGELSQGGLNVRVPFLLRRFGTYFRSSNGAPTLRKNDGAALRANAQNK